MILFQLMLKRSVFFFVLVFFSQYGTPHALAHALTYEPEIHASDLKNMLSST